eukprot:353449-Chlamydomonas_euryale.AAC.6
MFLNTRVWTAGWWLVRCPEASMHTHRCCVWPFKRLLLLLGCPAELGRISGSQKPSPDGSHMPCELRSVGGPCNLSFKRPVLLPFVRATFGTSPLRGFCCCCVAVGPHVRRARQPPPTCAAAGADAIVGPVHVHNTLSAATDRADVSPGVIADITTPSERDGRMSMCSTYSAAARASLVSQPELLGMRRPRPHKIWKKKFIKLLVVGDSGGCGSCRHVSVSHCSFLRPVLLLHMYGFARPMTVAASQCAEPSGHLTAAAFCDPQA